LQRTVDYSYLERRSRRPYLGFDVEKVQAEVCTKAVKILEKGNKGQREFAKTLTKRISKLRKRKFEALGSLYELEDNPQSRKKLKATVEEILEAEENQIKSIVDLWVATYGSSDDNPPHQKTISFNV
jgi:ferritin-like protein